VVGETLEHDLVT